MIKDSSDYANIIKFYCKLNFKNKIYESLIDSVASESYINRNICIENNFEIQIISEPIRVKLANNHEISCSEKCKLMLNIPNHRHNYEFEFLVLNSLSSNLIIGNDFSFRYNGILNFKIGIYVFRDEEVPLIQNIAIIQEKNGFDGDIIVKA
ncbi:hypothetical protein H311_00377 [Anncaliia algerae PRA109]|nr:hypothetical protein H311_00377 [Anncaliia algerae PRA109]